MLNAIIYYLSGKTQSIVTKIAAMFLMLSKTFYGLQ